MQELAETVAAPAKPGAGAMAGKLRDEAKWLVLTVVLTLVIQVVIGAYGRWRFGSLRVAMAYAMGERLLVEPEIPLGSMPEGSRRTVKFAVTNMTGRPVTVLGARTTCTCAMITDLPVSLAPSETRNLQVVIAPRASAPRVTVAVTLFTDDPDHTELTTVLSGRVTQRHGLVAGLSR